VTLCWSRLLAILVDPWREEPTLEQFVKNCSHGKDSHWTSLWRIASHGRGPTVKQGKSVRSPPHEEE